MSDYIKAFGLIGKLKLWKHFFVPGLISMGLWAITICLAWFFSDDIAHFVLSWYPWETGKSVIEGVGTVLFFIVSLFIFYLIFRDLLLAVLGPFLSPISAKIEQHLTGQTILGDSSLKGQVRSNLRSVNLAWWLISNELIRVIPLSLLSLSTILFLPCSIIIFLTQSFYAGAGNMDFTLERHFSAKESKRFVRKYRGLSIGSGSVHMALFLFLPFIGWYLAPVLSTVASTITAHRKIGTFKGEL